MMQKAWCIIEEVLYRFSKSSITWCSQWYLWASIGFWGGSVFNYISVLCRLAAELSNPQWPFGWRCLGCSLIVSLCDFCTQFGVIVAHFGFMRWHTRVFRVSRCRLSECWFGDQFEIRSGLWLRHCTQLSFQQKVGNSSTYSPPIQAWLCLASWE